MTVVLGLVYPLAITGISQVVFPGKANGSKMIVNGKVVGSSLIAQSSRRPCSARTASQARRRSEKCSSPDPRYFQPRPSQTGYSGQRHLLQQPRPQQRRQRAKKSREYMNAYLQLEKPLRPGPDQRRQSRSTRSPSRPPGSIPTSPQANAADPGAPHRRRPPPAARPGRRA